MDPATIGAIASVIGGIGGLFRGGEKSSGTQSTQVTPGSWQDLGRGSQSVWNQAIDKLFGGQELTEKGAEMKAAMDADPTNGYLVSQYMGTPPEELYTKAPSLLKRMQEDFGYKKAASDQYLSQMGGVDTSFLEALARAVGQFDTNLGQARDMVTTPKFYLNMGGRAVGAVPGANRNAATILGQLAETGYNAGTNSANTAYQVGSNAAARGLTQAETYAPNTSEIDYFSNVLWPMVANLQGLRYQTPQTTETGSLSSAPSFLERLQQATQVVTPAIKQLKSVFGEDNETTG